MRSKIARIGVLAAGLLGLLGVLTPPADATTIKTVVFTAVAQLSGPLGYPCANGTMTVPNTKCPQQTPPLATTTMLPLPTNGPVPGTPNTSTRVHGTTNTRNFTVAPTTCLGTGVNINKLDKAPTHGVATCGFNATGQVTGWCGLSHGQGTAIVTDGLPNPSVPGGVNRYTINFHFTGIGGTLLVEGHVTKVGTNRTGLFTALVLAIPVPTTGLTGTLGNSCSGKTATTFQLVGTGGIVIITAP